MASYWVLLTSPGLGKPVLSAPIRPTHASVAYEVTLKFLVAAYTFIFARPSDCFIRSPPLKLKRADRDVVSVQISDRELHRSSIRINMRLLFEPRHEPAGPLQCQVEIIDAKEQEEAVAWCRVIRTHQGGVLVGAPFVQAEQDRSIRVEELAKVHVSRCRLRLAEE